MYGLLVIAGCCVNAGPEIFVEDDDHVIVTGVHECWFRRNGYSYARSVEFMSKFQSQVREGDRNAIADSIHYPLKVHGPAPMNIENRMHLLREFDRVFTPPVIAAVLAADPRLVFCRYTGIMLGRGVIWADCWEDGYTVRVICQTPLALKSRR